MPNGCRHSLSIYESLYNAITSLGEKEKRTTTNMSEVLLEEALTARKIKITMESKN